VSGISESRKSDCTALSDIVGSTSPAAKPCLPERSDHHDEPEECGGLCNRAIMNAQVQVCVGVPSLPRRRDKGPCEGDPQGDTYS
jgi:hypothetical protein